MNYTEFFPKVCALMYEHDPIDLKYGDNTDEYSSEARTVIARLQTCKSASDLTEVVHEEFCRWFNPETAGPKSNYEALAQEIWALAIASEFVVLRNADS